MILDDILAKRQRRLKEEMAGETLEALERRISKLPPARDFYGAVAGGGISVIAEVKKASPSKGVIREGLDVPAIARAYARGGADAISVLTERDFFLGDDGNIGLVRKECGLPILRKDFITDTWQVYQSRAIGADALLLIAACLGKAKLKRLLEDAAAVGLHALVEVHDRKELEAAAEAGARIIGINNRDLKTFDVSLEVTARLAPLVPSGVAVVSESGIFTPEDVKFVVKAGAHAVLVGESLMRRDNPEELLRLLKGG